MNKLILFIITISITGYSYTQIAVTEFMNNPVTSDAANEWIELYNYSPSSVNLKNWRLVDEDIDSTTISTVDLIMQPNTYLILAIDKDSMEYNWFGGLPNSQVIDYDNYSLGNSGDEIIIKDNTGAVIWSVAYTNDDVNGIATFLEYSHDFSSGLTVWGSKSASGIDRDSIDAASTTIGYQGDSATVDTNQGLSRYGDIKGSPLAGSYVPGTVSSIHKLNKVDEFSIYPNPVIGNTLQFSKPITGVIYSFEGKIVGTFINQKQINTESLKAGIYFVKTKTHTQKLIVK